MNAFPDFTKEMLIPQVADLTMRLLYEESSAVTRGIDILRTDPSYEWPRDDRGNIVKVKLQLIPVRYYHDGTTDEHVMQLMSRFIDQLRHDARDAYKVEIDKIVTDFTQMINTTHALNILVTTYPRPPDYKDSILYYEKASAKCRIFYEKLLAIPRAIREMAWRIDDAIERMTWRIDPNGAIYDEYYKSPMDLYLEQLRDMTEDFKSDFTDYPEDETRPVSKHVYF